MKPKDESTGDGAGGYPHNAQQQKCQRLGVF